MMGDLNFHVDDASNVDATRFSDCVNSVGMIMHVRGPTHKKGHTLDVLLTRSADEHLIRNVTVADMGLSDHYAVSYTLNICQQHTGMTNIKYRNFRTVNAVTFRQDIPVFRSEDLESLSVEQLVDMYDNTLTCLVDKHAPVKERSVRLRQDKAWYNEDLRNEKRVKRQKEIAWRKSKLEVHRQIYVDQCKRVNNLLTKTKAAYYSHMVSDAGNNQQRLFRIVNRLLHRKGQRVLPVHTSSAETAKVFSEYVSGKIDNICRELSACRDADECVDNNTSRGFTSELSSFVAPPMEVIKQIITDASANPNLKMFTGFSLRLHACGGAQLPVL